MTILVVGASGATGRLLVKHLLDRELSVRVIVRFPEKMMEHFKNNDNLSVIHASVLELSDEEMAQHVKGCHAVASCLGHNLSFKGIFGHPRRLVTDATRRLCEAVKANTATRSAQPVKFILMNTTGNSNRDFYEPISFAQKLIISVLRLLLPPHVDNEKAADYLRLEVGQKDGLIEWVVVRPDGLIDEDEVSGYDVHPSPIRSAIFDAGKTSRVNVGSFMADLITDQALWKKWQGQMPVIYNKEY